MQRDVFASDRWKILLPMLALESLRPFFLLAGFDVPEGFSENEAEEIRKKYGEEFLNHLTEWGEHVFQYAGGGGVDAFVWHNLVIRRSREDSPAPAFIRAVRSELKNNPPLPTTPSIDIDGVDPVEFLQATISHVRFMKAWKSVLKDHSPNPEELMTWAKSEARMMNIPEAMIRIPNFV